MNELNVFCKNTYYLKKYKLNIHYSTINVVTLPLDTFNHRK